MQVLRGATLERFADRLAARFAAVWPQQVSELGEGYRRFIHSGIHRAASYGIESESAVARFVNLSFIWGPDFETQPEHEWAMKILSNSNLPGQRKVNDLVFRTKLKLRALEANKGLYT